MSYNLKQSWVELEQSLGFRPVLKGSVQEIRGITGKLIEMLMPQIPAPSDACEVSEGDVDGIKYRVYVPKEASKQGPLPVGIWTHGGGFVTGDLNNDDLLCRIVAEHTPTIMVNVDYRLAPEHKSPAQREDTIKVYEWARKNAASFGGNPDKFFSAGGSAGGALALMLANYIVKDPSKRASFVGVAAVTPASLHWDNVPNEYKSMYTAYEDNKKGTPIIDGESMATFYEAFGADPKDSDTFVALAKDNHKNFPPTYFVSCEFDPLRDDAYVMEAALKKAGVPTKHDHYKGFPHYFWIFPSVPEGQEFVGNLIGGIKWLLSQS